MKFVDDPQTPQLGEVCVVVTNARPTDSNSALTNSNPVLLYVLSNILPIMFNLPYL
jgi:hypothetical protein